MPDILYGRGSYRRDNGNFAELKLVNMFAERIPTTETGVAILSRYGLASSGSLGSSPAVDKYQRPGLFGGDTFTVTEDNKLYRATTLIGTISGTGAVTWASSGTEIVVTRGATAYSYNGTNLQAIAFPDSANVTAVTGTIGGRFIYARAGSGRFYWSDVLDGRTISGIAYATAESAPDNLRDVKAIGDNLYLLGEETVETHYLTGDNDLPFSRISQRTFRKGVISAGCAIEIDNALHWIGTDFAIYRMADVPTRISHNAMDERVGEATSWKAFSFAHDGHEFMVVRLSQGSWLYDPSIPGEWPEWQTHGLDNWIANCAVTVDGVPEFGSSEDGKILGFSGWLDDGTIVERRWTGAFGVTGGSVPVDSIEIVCNAGAVSPSANPQVEMRQSRDGGKTFGTWRTKSLGASGEYRKHPRWNRCGYFNSPGAMFDFRVIDNCGIRVSAVLINETAAGRSR